MSEPTTSPVIAAGPVTLYYDQSILEVDGAAASPVAVIRNRDGRYLSLGVELLPLSRSGRCAVRIRGWSSGRRPE
jgi:hypothetical protein